MKLTALLVGVLAGVPALAAAQQPQQTLYFSTRFAETPASGRAGDALANAAVCLPQPVFGSGTVIESAICNSQGVGFVIPGAPNTVLIGSNPPVMVTDFVELSNFPQFQLYIGDSDGDGIPHESASFPGIDALHIVSPALGRPNNIHEMFVSMFSSAPGGQGYTGTNLDEADLFLLPAANNTYPTNGTPQAPVFFVRRADWITLLGLPPAFGGGLDLNAFTVDPATGDIYCSFDDASVSGALTVQTAGGPLVTTTINRGDIIRIPGAAYTPSGPYGIVTAPLLGLAERVYSAPDVQTMMTAAGGMLGAGVTGMNVYGLSMDPNGGVRTSPAGFTHPNLLFTIDNRGGTTAVVQNTSSTAVYSTVAGGQFAVLNNTIMDGPSPAGIGNTSFSIGFFSGPLDAISVIAHTPALDPVADRPVHLDTFPTSGIVSDPLYNGRVVCYVSGLPPGAIAGVFARLDVLGAGGFVSRTNISAFLPGYPDLYVDPLQLANTNCVLAPANFPIGVACQNFAAQSYFNNPTSGSPTPIPGSSVNPVTVFSDPVNGLQNGDTCFELDMATFLPPGSVPLNPPPLVTLQVWDLSTGRLSSPICLQFN